MARPPLYEPEEFKKEINNYFEHKKDELIENDKKMSYMSIYDICAFLDISYDTWRRYEKKEDYESVIKRAKTKIFNNWIRQLFFPGRNSTGAMFYLKNALGWTDKREMKATIERVQEDKKLADLSDQQVKKLNEAFDALEDQENAIDITPEEEKEEE